MKLDNVSKKLLEKISALHELPSGALSFRKNGRSEIIRSTANIEIEKKTDNPGINLYIHSSCQGEACHIPVVVSEDNLNDLVYNDFYIEPNAKVVIVAGCGLHTNKNSSHNGIHTFHIGENASVTYIENHLALGNGQSKMLNPQTIVYLGKGAEMIMNTTQLGGVDYANRITKAVLDDNSSFVVNEKILTSRFNVAKTKFNVTLKGQNSKCNVISKSVAKDESEQTFVSNLIGYNACFGRVECDGILLNKAKIISQPKISAKHNQASLSHEATIGKIAGDQLVKLMTLGLSEEQSEQKIIEGFLK